ncbi:hypothetical protein V7S76_06350 [Aquirufa sp. ROCK2-A2]
MEKVIVNHGKYKIELEPFVWRKIKRGEKYDIYRRKSRWEFNQVTKGSCNIEIDAKLIETSIDACKIEFIESRNHLEIRKFQDLFIPFILIPTWTKEKHHAYKILRNYMGDCRSKLIISSRDNKTTKVHFVNHFTIFKVENLQRGIMKPYRNQYVLMYEIAKYNFQHYLEIYPLNETITEEILSIVALKSQNYYVNTHINK